MIDVSTLVTRSNHGNYTVGSGDLGMELLRNAADDIRARQLLLITGERAREKSARKKERERAREREKEREGVGEGKDESGDLR